MRPACPPEFANRGRRAPGIEQEGLHIRCHFLSLGHHFWPFNMDNLNNADVRCRTPQGRVSGERYSVDELNSIDRASDNLVDDIVWISPARQQEAANGRWGQSSQFGDQTIADYA